MNPNPDQTVMVGKKEIPRYKAAFSFRQLNKNLFEASDGTMYAKMPNGNLVRLTPKNNRKLKKKIKWGTNG